jgi:hypothetical protein
MADEMQPTEETTAASPLPRPPEFPTDYSQLSTIYTNFARVNVTPEELVLYAPILAQLGP